MVDRREAPADAVHLAPGMGGAWACLVDDLADEVVALDPGATVWGAVGTEGLLQVRVLSRTIDARTRRRMCSMVQARAARMCELCGETGHVRAGAIVTIVCPACG